MAFEQAGVEFSRLSRMRNLSFRFYDEVLAQSLLLFFEKTLHVYLNSVKICRMTDVFLHQSFSWLRSKAQPALSHPYRYMLGGTASDKSEISFGGFGKSKSVLTSAPMPIKFVT
ncbi:MAG: hypothetical protein CMI22_04840 [Opitutae bacterium]|nr:hypothetical protein [Opitutae bacterium]